MKTAVCLLVVRFGKILSISRRNDTLLWGLPGGKVDEFESNIEALAREVSEELGVTAAMTAYEPLYVSFCPGKLAPPVDYWVTTYLWVDTPIKDHELDPEKGFELRWMTRDQLEDPAISPFWEYNKEVFKAFDVFTEGKGFAIESSFSAYA